MLWVMPPRELPDPHTLCAGIASVLEDYPEVAAAWLFGSAASDAPKDAHDLDVGLLLADPEQAPADCYMLLGDIASRLEALSAPLPVDLVVLDPLVQGPLFCHEVLLTGRLCYEADRDRRLDFASQVPVRAFDWRPTWELASKNGLAGYRRWLEERRP